MSLAPEWRLGALSLVDAPFLVAFGADHGSPESSADVLASFLTDGDIEVGGHTGNRTVVIPILLEGSDLLELSEAEKALIAESVKAQNTLYVDPGDGFAPPFQMTVFGGPGSVVWNRDDVYEQQGYRSFTLTLRALPYVYSATETITPALAASGTTTATVDDLSSATGWAGMAQDATVTPTAAAGAGTLTVDLGTPASGLSPAFLSLTRTGSIDTSSTQYLLVDWKPNIDGSVDSFTARANSSSVGLAKIAEMSSPSTGFTRTWFQSSVPTITDIRFQIVLRGGYSSTNATLTLDNLARSDVRPTIGSNKQQLRTLDVGGSAPTTGSLAVSHATAALGNLLVYTCPDDNSGYAPSCRPYWTGSSGSTSVDSSTASGSYDSLAVNGSSTFDVPTRALPEGEYLVMGSVAGLVNATSAVISWSAVPVLGATLLSSLANGPAITIPTAGADFYRMGMIHLPTMAMPDSPLSKIRFSAYVVSFGGASSGAAVRFDELLLYNMTTGDLSQFKCGTGTPAVGGPAKRLWIDSPAVTNDGLGQYVMGTAADRSDAFSAAPSAASLGVHDFEPGSMKVHTVAMGPATAVDVALEHRRAWMHTAAS